MALLIPAAGMASAASGTAVLGWSPVTSAGTYNYGTLTSGQTARQTFVLTNSGTTTAASALKISLASSSGFTMTGDACSGTSVGPGKSCSVTVTFAPAGGKQSYKATLTATSAKPVATATLTLLGAGTKASPAIATTPGGGGPAGATTVTDTATLSGGSSPTGSITFRLYGPSTSPACATPVDTEMVTVTGDGSYKTPAGARPAQPGTYWWTAAYSGDAGNAPAASSCGTEQVVLTRAALVLSPSSGEQGAAFTAKAAGFGAGETVSISFNGAAAGSCTADASGSCTASAFVPSSVPAGSYTVTAKGAVSGLSAAAGFAVTPFLSVSPSSGRAGSAFTASAAGFAANEAVSFSFAGVPVGVACTANSAGDCQATLTVPAGLAAGADTVTATGGTSRLTASAAFTVTPSPSLSLSAVSGAQGSSFTAQAAGFAAGETVSFSFNGAAAGSCTADGSGGCSAGVTVPALAAGGYAVTATGASNDTASATFTITPSLTLSPASGPPGSVFLMAASGFAAGDTVSFSIGLLANSCAANAAGDCSAYLTAPGGPSGVSTVRATGAPSGLTASAAFNQTVSTTLTLSPASGPQGSSFTAQAAGFAPGETVSFSFNGFPAPGSCTADPSGGCSAGVTVPALPGGSYTVSAQGQTSRLIATAAFTITPSLILSAASGVQGSSFTAQVTDFPAGETVDISFAGNPTGSSCTTDPTGGCSASVTVPAALAGTVNYPVTAAGETSGLTAEADFFIQPSLSVSPSAGQAGSAFTAQASGFAAGETVSFSYGTASAGSCPANAAGDCSVTVTVPVGAAADVITVTATGGSSGLTAGAVFTVAPSLILSAVSGAQGSSFTAQAAGFTAGETVSFSFNGAAAGSCTADSSGGCSAGVTVPALPGGSYTVSAEDQIGPIFSLPATFTITPSLVLDPASGQAGSTFTAQVTGFAAGETVSFSYGTASAGSCTADSTGDCSASVTVPASPAGAYTVTAAGEISGLTAMATFTQS